MIKKIKGTAQRPRLYVFRSNQHIYAQVIDDTTHKILLSSSSISNTFKISIKSTATCESSQKVGQDIAIQCKNKGITHIVFDRGKRLYHGRIKALAQATREAGINF